MSNNSIAIVDCAIKIPAHACFERLQKHFNLPLTYHHPSQKGMDSLIKQGRPRAIVVLGSKSDVHERLGWQVALGDYVMEQLQWGTPVLGICFGHQLLASRLGLTVDRVEKVSGHKGSRQISIDPKMQAKWGSSYHIVVSHFYEVKDLNDDFDVIASSPECAIDAIAHKELPFVGFQGHPEASDTFINNDDAIIVSDSNRLQAQSDGLQLIGNFFKLYL